MSNQQLLMIGAHQRNAPLAIRERLAYQAEILPEALAGLSAVTSEALLLSTCNRTEIYAVLEGRQPDPRPVLRALAQHSGIAQHELLRYVRILSGVAVARHASRLAAGLDSMVLGEPEIVGQIRDALALAQAQGALGQILHRLFQGALEAGKRVRTETAIARSHLSVVSVALDLARREFGGLRGRRVLVIGAGQTAELALKHLADEQPAQVTVVNRTLARAELLAGRYGAQARDQADLEAALGAADLALSCTAAPEALVDAPMAARALAGRERLLLLDLAVPRDIERSVRQVAGIRLFDVDDMESICAANRAGRAAEVTQAELLIDEVVGKFQGWWAARHATPTIRALRERAEAIRDAEVQRTLARLPQLGERERAAIQAMSEAIVNKLLHPPIASLKEPDGGELIGATRRLFQIGPALEDAPPPALGAQPEPPPCGAACATLCAHCPAIWAA